MNLKAEIQKLSQGKDFRLSGVQLTKTVEHFKTMKDRLSDLTYKLFHDIFALHHKDIFVSFIYFCYLLTLLIWFKEKFHILYILRSFPIWFKIILIFPISRDLVTVPKYAVTALCCGLYGLLVLITILLNH